MLSATRSRNQLNARPAKIGEWRFAPLPLNGAALLKNAPPLIFEQMKLNIDTKAVMKLSETGFGHPDRLKYVDYVHIVFPAEEAVMLTRTLDKVGSLFTILTVCRTVVYTRRVLLFSTP